LYHESSVCSEFSLFRRLTSKQISRAWAERYELPANELEINEEKRIEQNRIESRSISQILAK
jgi:hypothetical protein